MTETPPHLLGTQARILMTEWQALAKLIVAHSTPAKDKPITNLEELESFDIDSLENITFSTAEEIPHILAEKHIQAALQGPFGSLIKEKMAAYAKISRLRMEIHLSKEELFKTRRAEQPESERIPAKKLEKLSFSQLDDLQQQLDELTEQHNREWQEFIQQWTDHLIDFFSEAHLALTEREIKELKDEDIATELLPRFIEVGVKLPQKSYPQLSFTDYLYLKAMLTTQSALSRQHLAHDDAEIQQALSGFKSGFAQMREQEQLLSDQQKKMTASLISSLP